MPRKSKKEPLKPKKPLSIPQFYGYTHKDFKKWGKLGGRPQKYANVAERMRAYRLRKKREKFGEKAELRNWRSYGEIQIKKISIACPNCGKVETDLRKYFNPKGEFIKETYWFDTVRMEKRNIRENEFHCSKCSWAFSFQGEQIKVKETKIIVPKSGSVRERVKRWKEKKSPLRGL